MTGPSTRTCAALLTRLRGAYQRAPLRLLAAFFLFGLINNVLYVIILSAALDLVGPGLPKGLVLLFDVVPGFAMKLVAPYFIHAVPYATRVPLIAGLAAAGMLLVALSPPYTDGGTIATKMAGVVLASASSGAGELSFLGLTHHYGHASLAAWGSGTGAAGLVGAGAYALATTVLGWGVRATLQGSAVLPLGMVLSFFAILPPRDARRAAAYAPVSTAAATEAEVEDEGFADGPDLDDVNEGLLSQNGKRGVTVERPSWLAGFRANLHRAKGLFWPFMMPLLLVYVAEYTINQGLFPVLLFPLAGSPFKHYRAFYPTYNAIYQVGNLAFLVLQAVFDFVPSVYLIFIIVFWEGLLGGLVYVNTFAEILDTVPDEEREFSLSATSVSDSGGICIAGFIGMALEVSLCSYQVSRGRDFCRKL